jgi:hypothetical protein
MKKARYTKNIYGADATIKKSNDAKNLSSYISPVQLQRLRQDTTMWRNAITEAEYAYFPYRVKMQQMYIDTILNGHVASLMERRQDLTLLRDFKIVDDKDVQSDVLTEMFKEAEWFEDFQAYSLDALFFGYSLISLGDIKDDAFTDVSIVRRWLVSPDRLEASSFIYQPSGNRFDQDPFNPWHVYVKTRSENGVSPCGYGLFYKIALYEIFLRNTLGFNGDFVELYSQPYRVGKTTKTTEDERAQLEAALQNMGSSGYAVIDPSDDIQFLETALGGTGYKGYESLESRCQATVSKLVLGHADAVDSTPGKLGGGQGKTDGLAQDGSPVAMALADKQSKDGKMMSRIINSELFPRMRKLGLKIPENMKFVYNNDAEIEQMNARKDASAGVIATTMQAIKNAGGTPDWDYFKERTGMSIEQAPPPEPLMPGKPGEPQPGKEKLSDKTKNRLKKLYGE